MYLSVYAYLDLVSFNSFPKSIEQSLNICLFSLKFKIKFYMAKSCIHSLYSPAENTKKCVVDTLYFGLEVRM